MPEFQLTTPVAFIIFNRPDVTEKVFAEIAKARPNRMLIVGDGPRADRLGEAEKVAAAREIIERVDWDCEVSTNFSESNLGCKHRVSSGLDWVFDQVGEAIILEDDCLPDPSFFRFCQELLERYRDDQRIGLISGDNFQFGKVRGEASYYFSNYVHIWGWASWRDRWTGSYDVTMRDWPRIRDQGWLNDIICEKAEADYWARIFDRVYRGEIDTWDYQWVFANWMNGRLSILPVKNLVSNIGFGGDATHTQASSVFAEMETEAIEFPIRHPPVMVRNTKADSNTNRMMFNRPLWRRIMAKVGNQFAK